MARENLKKARQKTGMTQKQVAKYLNADGAARRKRIEVNNGNNNLQKH